MKPLRVAEARARFGEILDDVEKGVPVVIERHGVRFRVVAEPAAAEPESGRRLFEYVAPEIAAGDWTWNPGPKGMRLTRRRPRR